MAGKWREEKEPGARQKANGCSTVPPGGREHAVLLLTGRESALLIQAYADIQAQSRNAVGIHGLGRPKYIFCFVKQLWRIP